ncbi:MAG: hypothetical protein ACYS0F_17865 [Planctomycetota bacterium]
MVPTLLLAVAMGCVAITGAMDDAMGPLRITRAYEGEPRPRSEVARIRTHTEIMEGVGQPDIPGHENQIKVRIQSVNGFSCGEHPGGAHYYEVLPGNCLLEILWQRSRWHWYGGPPLDGLPSGVLVEGTTGIRITVKPGKRYALEITPTEYGAPTLELKEL